MNYVYYFTNAYNKILYVGKTGNIKKRIRQHFTAGHLPEVCYQSVNQIFYAETGNSLYDNEILETMLIDLWKPLYNTDKVYSERSERMTFRLPALEWKEIWWTGDEAVTAKPPYKCFDLKELTSIRIKSILEYNQNLLTSRPIYVTDLVPCDVPLLISICKNAEIDTDNSSVDIPLDTEEYDCAHAGIKTTYDTEELISCGMLMRLDGGGLAMPLYTDKALRQIQKSPQ